VYESRCHLNPHDSTAKAFSTHTVTREKALWGACHCPIVFAELRVETMVEAELRPGVVTSRWLQRCSATCLTQPCPNPNLTLTGGCTGLLTAHHTGLMQPRAARANAADAAAGLVRDGGATVRNYNTSRQYATTSVADKLTEALSRMTTLQVRFCLG